MTRLMTLSFNVKTLDPTQKLKLLERAETFDCVYREQAPKFC